LHLVYAIYCGIHRIPVEKYDTFCKRVKKIRNIVIDREETDIMINEARKNLREKDSNGDSKKTRCWSGIKLIDEYARELLAAKAEQTESEGQETLDDN